VFYEVEAGRTPSSEQRLDLETKRIQSEQIIFNEIGDRSLNSFVNEDVIRTLSSKRRSDSYSLSNWLLVFNWDTASFVSWSDVDRDPDLAVAKYSEYEKQFTTDEGYEVVLVGSSDINTIQETHSHYFGISPPDSVLESLDDSLLGISTKMDLGIGARKILSAMYRKKFWSAKSTSPHTLKNHFCADVSNFESSLQSLIERGFVIVRPLGGISLNIKSKNQIEQYI